MKLIVGTTILFCLLLFVSACSFDPPHENPNDPFHPAYQPLGVLRLKVVKRSDFAPIENAAVSAIRTDGGGGQIQTTDVNGNVEFSELPEGRWLVVAGGADASNGVVFGRDTILVDVSQKAIADTFMQLNALPYFTAIRVNAIAQEETDSTGIRMVRKYLRLTAQVDDPDGTADIRRVIWQSDTLDMSGEMQYQQVVDSSYWWAVVQENELPGRQLTDALGADDVSFIAYDQPGQFTQSNETNLKRIVNHVVDPTQPGTGNASPTIEWHYNEIESDFSGSLSQFHYRLRIFAFPNTLVYDTLIVPEGSRRVWHTVGSTLPATTSFMEIWVEDVFYNSSRTQPISLSVTSTN